MKSARALDPGYRSEIDIIDEHTWHQLLPEFEDANIYQTWSYSAVTAGVRNICHMVLRKDGEIEAIAQARIARIPLIHAGIAYVFWGPLWRRGKAEENAPTFRQAIRALRNEFVCKRRLGLRLFPLLFQHDAQFAEILSEEGFGPVASPSRSRTILMDLSPSVDQLREGMKSHWKRELKLAERNQLEVVEGTGEELFDSFIEMYREMVARKHFVEPNDINEFRAMQRQLPENLRMKIMLCRSDGKLCAGLICSAIGKSAVYLFGATSNAGMKSNGSYGLQWSLIQSLKRDGVAIYNLNGINPEHNPGTYKFKNDLAGRNGADVCFLGRFDSHASAAGQWFVKAGESLKSNYRSFKQLVKAGKAAKPLPKPAG